MMIASLTPYLALVWAFSPLLSLGVMWRYLVQFATLGTSLTLLICGFALIYASKPRKIKSLLWLPFVYFYWSFQAFIALYAALLILLRRPNKWLKTEKSGALTISVLEEQQVAAENICS
jgi:hypothetical protein